MIKAKTYKTGKPCKNGHIAERYVSTGACVECVIPRNRKSARDHWRKKHLPKPTRPEPTICECCGREGQMRLDHDHITNTFRGWICDSCNVGIARLGDDIKGVENALAYLRKNMPKKL